MRRHRVIGAFSFIIKLKIIKNCLILFYLCYNRISRKAKERKMEEQKELEKTVAEELIEQFTAAIHAELGDKANKLFTKYCIGKGDILSVANKVVTYMDLWYTR